jgi:hypothetical protein
MPCRRSTAVLANVFLTAVMRANRSEIGGCVGICLWIRGLNDCRDLSDVVEGRGHTWRVSDNIPTTDVLVVLIVLSIFRLQILLFTRHPYISTWYVHTSSCRFRHTNTMYV